MVEMRSLGRLLKSAPWRLSLLHSAPDHRILWLTQGQGRILLNAQRRGVGTNNFLFVPAGEPFSLEGGHQLTGHMLAIGRDDPTPWPSTGYLLRTREVGYQGEIIALFDALSREQVANRDHCAEALAAQARLVSVWLRRQIAAAGDVPEASSAGQRLIAAFMADLERLHPTGATMADYAERLDVTPTHLSRVCKTRLGRSAADLVTERSLHAARHLLETTRKPAKTIAEELGFGSAAYFSRFILSHTGRTPKALRGPAAGAREQSRPQTHTAGPATNR